MKKLAVLGMGVCIALAFSSCKSSESAYKKAYEKAKQQELAEPQTTAPAEEVPSGYRSSRSKGGGKCTCRHASGKGDCGIRWYQLENL